MFTKNVTMANTRAQSQLRGILEGFAAKHAAMRITEGADTGPLLEAFEQLESAAKKRSHKAFHEADLKLHQAIVTLAGVPSLEDAWKCVAAAYSEFHWTTLKTCWPDLCTLFEGHRTIVDAICDGNVTLAEYSAVTHHNAIWYRLAEQNDGLFSKASALQRATAYIALHLDQPIRLESVAREISYTSPGHLSRLFRQEHGISFQAYVQKMRMKQAANLLIQSSLKVSQVAEMVGYTDASRFGVHFSRHFGVPPSRMRKTEPQQ